MRQHAADDLMLIWHVGCKICDSFIQLGGERSVTKTISVLTISLLVALAAGCSMNQAANTNANDNANAANATAATSPTTTAGPDNSEITTSVDATGTRTDTRVFKNNPRISRVVVTTRAGKRTVRATSAKGEERDVNTDDNVLEATGEAVANAAGFVADKAENVAGAAKEKTENAAEKTVDTSKKVGAKAVHKTKSIGEKTVDTSKDVGAKTVDTSKTIGEKTVEGARKVGSKTKKAVKKVIP